MGIPLSENNIPVTIVSGYANAGKTVLLNHVCENIRSWKIAVIQVGGGFIVNQQPQNAGDDNIVFVYCASGDDILKEMKKLAEQNIDYLLIENAGISNPLALLKIMLHKDKCNAFDAGESYRLDTMVTVIDSFNFIRDYSGIDAIAGNPKQLNSGQASITDILTLQMEYADVIILNKTDLVTASLLNMIRLFVQVTNESAVILESSFGKIHLSNILNTGLFNVCKFNML